MGIIPVYGSNPKFVRQNICINNQDIYLFKSYTLTNLVIYKKIYFQLYFTNGRCAVEKGLRSNR